MSNRNKLVLAVVASVCLSAAAALRLSAAQDAASGQSQGDAQQAASTSADGRYFEMRTYHVPEGKMEALHNRFRNHTNRLFKKHGIDMVGYWTVAAKEGEAPKNALVFILAYPSQEEQPKRWGAFINDPEWKKAAAESEKGGRLVAKVEQVFLRPTDYSPVK